MVALDARIHLKFARSQELEYIGVRPRQNLYKVLLEKSNDVHFYRVFNLRSFCNVHVSTHSESK